MICSKLVKIHLKVAKFYRRLYLPNLFMSKVEKNREKVYLFVFLFFCFLNLSRVDLGPFHEVSFHGCYALGPPDLILNPTNDSTTTTLPIYSRLPITRTFKGNRKKVRVNGSSSYREFEENSRE